MAEAIKVLIADDHAVVRAGLVGILGAESDIAIVGEARDGLEAIEKALELEPDVILMDIFMPRSNGLEALAAIRQKLAATRVLILTISEREEDLFEALRFGAEGYLLKSATITEVVDAVRRTAGGESMLSPNIATKLVAEFNNRVHKPKLSSREVEVLRLLGEGLTNTEIASRLFISESTVRTHFRRLLDKLHLKNRAEAIAYAARHHLTTTPF
jgi:DNA-binding NarL/FixJ family response regulator